MESGVKSQNDEVKIIIVKIIKRYNHFDFNKRVRID